MSLSAQIKSKLAEFCSNPNYRMSLILLALTVLWLLSGLFKGEQESAQAELVPQLMNVRARHIKAQAYEPTVFVRGRSQADKKIALRSELDGKVIAIPGKEGQLVNKGDVICQLALEDRQLRVQEAQSMADRAQIEYDGSLKLRLGGYQSRTAIASSKANLDSAKANLKRKQLDLNNVSLRAPFAGLVESHRVDPGDYLRKGDTCATVLDLNPLVISGQVSEAEVIQLTQGSTATVSLLSGEVLAGRLSYIAHDSNDVTRTYRVEIKLDNPGYRLRSGLTAEVAIPVANVLAHHISTSILSLDDSGQLGVKVLDDNNRAHLYRVKIIGDHQEGVWVTGLPEQSLLITRGQEYVSDGEEVLVSLEPLMDDALTQSINTEALSKTEEITVLDPLKSNSVKASEGVQERAAL